MNYSKMKTLISLSLIFTILVLINATIFAGYNCLNRPATDLATYESPADFECFDNTNGPPSGRLIVPNIVHFIKWNDEISFMEAICMLAAVVNQRPDKVYVHTDRNITGKYWDMVMNVSEVSEVVEVKYLPVPTHVFGQALNSSLKYFHGGDVARLEVLIQYGGIYLDGDTFLVRSLDHFRKFEMTLGWQQGNYLANQAVIAHKHARFLRRWYYSYQYNYKGNMWYYNTGEYPTLAFLKKQPFLIHRMKALLCEDFLHNYLYLENHNSWRNHYAIHLSLRRWTQKRGPGEPESWTGLKKNLSSTATYPVVFNETNILEYNCTLGEMVRSVMAYLPI